MVELDDITEATGLDRSGPLVWRLVAVGAVSGLLTLWGSVLANPGGDEYLRERELLLTRTNQNSEAVAQLTAKFERLLTVQARLSADIGHLVRQLDKESR